jgi:hypothetical protein
MRRLTRTLPALLALAALLTVAPAALARTTVLSGVVQLNHGDAKTPGAPARYLYSLRTTTGSVALRLAGPKSLTPGSYVRVRGTRRGALLRVTGVRRVAPPNAAARRLVARTQFAVKAAPASPQLAVVLINFSDNTSQPVTPAAVANSLFNNPSSVAAYYAEESYGKTTLTGTVFGWYTIAAPGLDCDANFELWASQARAKVGSAIDAYSNVMYIFPTLAACGWAGLGSMPGSETWINGYVQLRVMAHELGHNFGVHHANSYDCTVSGSRVSLGPAANCSSVEYGDPFSIMGSASTRQFPAFHKDELGWLQPTSTYTVTSSGTYTIAASELDTAATQLLRIPRAGRALYVDVRQPYGTYFDNFTAGSGPVNGVMLREGPSAYNRTQPRLIDATPGTATFNDAALAVGLSLTDPVSGVTITTSAITAGGATVTITVPGAGSAPSAPSNVVATPVTGGVNVTWSAATDDIGVVSYRVYRNGVLLGTTAGLSYPDTVTNGVLNYSVAAVDTESLVGPVGAAPQISVGDAVAPTTPTSLAATIAGATVTLSWHGSTDNVGVTSYRVYRNSVLLKTTTTTSTQDPTVHGGQSYAYSVRAVDAAANVSPPSEPLPVTIADGAPPSAVTLLKVAVHPKPWGATLTWNAATDNVGVTGYRVYRDAALIKTVTALTYTDAGLPHTDMAVYAVAAIDATGNEGTRARISAIPPDVDLTAPTAPRSLKAKALTQRRVRLTWPAATDDVGVIRYDVVFAGRVVLKTSKRTITIKLAGKRGKRVWVSVRAIDAAGNKSSLRKVLVRLH